MLFSCLSCTMRRSANDNCVSVVEIENYESQHATPRIRGIMDRCQRRARMAGTPLPGLASRFICPSARTTVSAPCTLYRYRSRHSKRVYRISTGCKPGAPKNCQYQRFSLVKDPFQSTNVPPDRLHDDAGPGHSSLALSSRVKGLVGINDLSGCEHGSLNRECLLTTTAEADHARSRTVQRTALEAYRSKNLASNSFIFVSNRVDGSTDLLGGHQ